MGEFARPAAGYRLLGAFQTIRANRLGFLLEANERRIFTDEKGLIKTPQVGLKELNGNGIFT